MFQPPHRPVAASVVFLSLAFCFSLKLIYRSTFSSISNKRPMQGVLMANRVLLSYSTVTLYSSKPNKYYSVPYTGVSFMRVGFHS